MFRAEIMGLGLLASTSMIFEQRLDVCGNPGRSIQEKGRTYSGDHTHKWSRRKKLRSGKTGAMLPDSSFCPTS